MASPADMAIRHAEVAIVPGSHGGFNRIDELNGRIAAFTAAQAASHQGGPDPGVRPY